MSLLHYLSSTLLKKFKKQSISDSSKISGGTAEEPEQNYVDSFYHS